jgi:hypothetical protein
MSDPQNLINALITQRNEAMNHNAQLMAQLVEAQQTVDELQAKPEPKKKDKK